MGLISIQEALSTGTVQFSVGSTKNSLREHYKRASPSDSWDIFLSHSYQDAKVNDAVLIGLKEILERFRYRVYIDWIDDAELDRTKVNRVTAERLKQRIGQCRSLFFATSESSAKSVWMPWELGCADGKHGKAAILPLVDYSTTSDHYVGQEYLGMYPYVEKTGTTLYVHRSATTYITFCDWLNGKSI